MEHACCGRHGECRSDIPGGRTVGDVVRDTPGAREVMEKLGINHCCGAGLTLREAAAAAGVPLDELLGALTRLEKAPA
jgi:regulator of cell morphogenesis and NO signaling